MTEIQTKLLEALRSGKYRQCVGTLRNTRNDCYCVGGVMCELSGLGSWLPTTKDNNTCFRVVGESRWRDGSVQTPYRVHMLFGVSHSDMMELQHHNDTGMSFLTLSSMLETVFNGGELP